MAGENVLFNLQQFLQDMRDEQNRNVESLSKKLDTVLDTQANHTTRLTLLERFRVNAVKVAWLGFGAFVVFLFDLLRDHLFASVKP